MATTSEIGTTPAVGLPKSHERRMPSEVDAERLVLGSILLDTSVFASVIRLLDREEYFYLDAHQLYQC